MKKKINVYAKMPFSYGNGIIRGKFVLLCLPGRSKKRTLFQDISGGMVSDHTGSYVFSGQGDKWGILFLSRA